jgi:hypothetical protein
LIEDISIGSIQDDKTRTNLVNVNKEEVAYFRSVEPEIKIIEGFILQGRVVTMNMDTYRGTVEYL